MLGSGELDRDATVVECERLRRARGDTRGLRHHTLVPLWVGGRTIGVLNLVGSEAGLFSEEDLRVLGTVGNQVGISLERARLHERLEQLVVERTAALTAEVAERRLAEDKYRAIFDNFIVGIFQTTLDGRYLAANAALARIYGYDSPAELMATVTDLSRQFYVEPDRRAEFVRQVEGHGRVLGFESRIRRKDGGVLWISEDARALRDAGGRLAGFEGITMDITARKQAEESRERLTAILDATPDFVAISDPQGCAVYLNPGGRKLIGMDMDEDVAGFQISAGHPEWARRRLLEEAMPLATRDGVWSGETALLSRDGREIPVWQILLAHRAPGGTVDFFSTIVRDLSKRKRLEEQFRLAQKMEAVAALSGGVAHDFNNLLTAMRANADFALMDLPPESPVRENLHEIREAVDRAVALTRQLLTFGRKQVLEPRAVDLNVLLQAFSGMLSRILGADLAVVMRLTPDAAWVWADPGQLEQVVMNLCVNARDAMPQGGELALLTDRLTLDDDYCVAHPWARPGDYLRLTVSDTGVGMDEPTRARIFEPFFTTKEVGRGTGLGLAVVYSVVQQHDGLIYVYSEPGRGTSFKIYLPSHAEAPEAQVPEAAAALVGGSETILLAEDDDGLRATAMRCLERLGYRVLPVSNGSEALEVLEQQGSAIQLALLDVVMPGLGGPQIFERIGGRFPGLRFLFTTGYSPGTFSFAPVNALPAPVLPKPYGVHALAQAVRSTLAP